MILVCGGTGMLGSRVATRLRTDGHQVRALVRPSTDAGALEAIGADVVRGDIRDRASLDAAVAGATAVVSTVNTVARVMGGEAGLTIRDVDERGHLDLIEAAEAAGAERFVFLSFVRSILDSGTPFARAKLAVEERLRQSSMRAIVVRPEMFQEVWLTELVQFDWQGGTVTIFGKGRTPHRYISVDDVAALVVHLLGADDPPPVVEVSGPEAMTRIEAAEAYERATGRPIKRRHVPRLGLMIGSTVLRPFKPVLSSIMGQALASDRAPSAADDAPLRAFGIDPIPVSRYIAEAAAAHRDSAPAS
jgi:uncharacterized protein YbjT (DUF2867 family)